MKSVAKNDFSETLTIYANFYSELWLVGERLNKCKSYRHNVPNIPLHIKWLGWARWINHSRNKSTNMIFLEQSMWIDAYYPLSLLSMEDDLYNDTLSMLDIIDRMTFLTQADFTENAVTFLSALCWNFPELPSKGKFINSTFGEDQSNRFLIDIGTPPIIKNRVVNIIKNKKILLNPSYLSLENTIKDIGANDTEILMSLINISSSSSKYVNRYDILKLNSVMPIIDTIAKKIALNRVVSGNLLKEMGYKPGTSFALILEDARKFATENLLFSSEDLPKIKEYIDWKFQEKYKTKN